jgi:hypothetical protein
MARVAINNGVRASGSFPITDYQYLAGKDFTTSFTVTDYSVMNGAEFEVPDAMMSLIAGTDFALGSSNSEFATNYCVALNTAVGEDFASAVGAVVTVSIPGGAGALAWTWNGATGVSPASGSFAGGYDVSKVNFGSANVIFGDGVEAGSSNLEAATNLATYINNSSENANITASVSSTTVNITYNTAGTAGNSYAISIEGVDGGTTSGGITASGSTLSGGVAGTNPRVQIPQQQNLLAYSEDLSQYDLTRVTVDSNATTAPDGTLTADKLVPTTANNTHTLSEGLLLVGGLVYTVSFWAKTSGYSWLRVSTNDPTNYASIDVTNGVIGLTTGLTATIENDPVYDSDFKLVTLQLTAPAGGGTLTIDANNADSASAVSWAANGTSGYYIWGLQIAATNYRPPYRQTTGSPYDVGGLRKLAANRTLIPSTQNLLLRSNKFDTTWTTLGGITLTDLTTHWRMTDAAATASFAVVQDGDVTILTAGKIAVAIIEAKKGTNDFVYLAVDAATQGGFFNLNTGATATNYGGTLGIKALEDGWYRCYVVYTMTSANPNNFRAYMAKADGAYSYTGDGTGTLFIRKAQMAQTNWALPYTETTTAVVNTGGLRKLIN